MTKAHAILPFALLLAACSDHEEAPLTDEEFATMAEGAPVNAPEDAEADAVSVHEKDELIDFSFSYPAEAAAIAKLNADLDDRLAAARDDLRTMAEQEASFRKEEGFPFNGLYSKSTYTVAGNSERFLSLLGEIETYTGGAHGNRGTVAIFWDRVTEKPVDATLLFGNADTRDRLLSATYCEKLEAERRKRVGVVPDDSMFGNCPKLDTVTILAVDANDDGLFDGFQLIADPYVAGAYAEGDYRIDIPLTDALRDALDEPYRDAFGQ